MDLLTVTAIPCSGQFRTVSNWGSVRKESGGPRDQPLPGQSLDLVNWLCSGLAMFKFLLVVLYTARTRFIDTRKLSDNTPLQKRHLARNRTKMSVYVKEVETSWASSLSLLPE